MNLPKDLRPTHYSIKQSFARFYKEGIEVTYKDGIHWVPTTVKGLDGFMYGWYAPFSNPIIAANVAQEELKKRK